MNFDNMSRFDLELIIRVSSMLWDGQMRHYIAGHCPAQYAGLTGTTVTLTATSPDDVKVEIGFNYGPETGLKVSK